MIAAEEEASRVVPIIAAARKAGVTVPISIDTFRASVARAAIEVRVRERQRERMNG